MSIGLRNPKCDCKMENSDNNSVWGVVSANLPSSAGIWNVSCRC